MTNLTGLDEEREAREHKALGEGSQGAQGARRAIRDITHCLLELLMCPADKFSICAWNMIFI